MKLISVVTPCYNEEENVRELHRAIKEVFEKQLPQYRYEHIYIDNASKDSTATSKRSSAAPGAGRCPTTTNPTPTDFSNDLSRRGSMAGHTSA